MAKDSVELSLDSLWETLEHLHISIQLGKDTPFSSLLLKMRCYLPKQRSFKNDSEFRPTKKTFLKMYVFLCSTRKFGEPLGNYLEETFGIVVLKSV